MFNKKLGSFIILVFLIASLQGVFAAQPLLNPSSTGFDGQTRSANYDDLIDALYANGKVATVVGGDKLWVPWYSRSDSCELSDLQSGNNCNSGTTIDSTHNCMVTDEFSQVGVLVAMSNDQARMDQFSNTVDAIASTNGAIPAWRIYRDGDTLEQCRSGINGNCDTASDATARIIIALFTAAKNPAFSSSAQTAYLNKAKSLSSAMLTYEVDQTCRPSSLGGEICYWLAAGSNAKRGGIASTDYAYTGYYADAIIAMLQAYAATGNQQYKDAAEDFGLNYLEAAKFNGNDFTVPPGRSYKWTVESNGVLTAQCTNGCNPVNWDDADAPRAFGMCQANYYATQMGVTLPGMQNYCDAWASRYGGDPTSIPTQYMPDGSAGVSSQSGYFAQGLQALFTMGLSDNTKFAQTLDSALSHYSSSSNTWDNSACFGVYTTAFSVRALGVSIGRDLASFTTMTPYEGGQEPAQQEPDQQETASEQTTTSCASSVDDLSATCTGGTITTDSGSGCRTIVCANGDSSMQVLACDKPDTGTKEYFEMYKQEQTGSAVTEICLGETCISTSGYVKSASYPICTEVVETTQPVLENPEVIEEPVVDEPVPTSEENNTVDIDEAVVLPARGGGGGSSQGPKKSVGPSSDELSESDKSTSPSADKLSKSNPQEHETLSSNTILSPGVTTDSPENSSTPWLFGIILLAVGATVFLSARRQASIIPEDKRAELHQYIETSVSRGYSPVFLEDMLLKHGWAQQHVNDAFTDLGISIDPMDSAIHAKGKEPVSQK